MRPASQTRLPVGNGPAEGFIRDPLPLDRLAEAIGHMLDRMRRELDDVRRDHEQLRSELADVTTIFRDIRRRTGLAPSGITQPSPSQAPATVPRSQRAR